MQNYFVTSFSKLSESLGCKMCQFQSFTEITKRDYELITKDFYPNEILDSIESDHQASGIIIHNILEWILADGLSSFQTRVEQVMEAMNDISEGYFENTLASKFLSGYLPSSIHDARVQRVTSRVIPCIRRLNFLLSKQPPKAIHTEMDLLYNSKLNSSQIAIVGRADLILEFEDYIEIVEYKTGNWVNEEKWWFQLNGYASCLDAEKIKITIIHPFSGKSRQFVDVSFSEHVAEIFSEECEHSDECENGI